MRPAHFRWVCPPNSGTKQVWVYVWLNGFEDKPSAYPMKREHPEDVFWADLDLEPHGDKILFKFKIDQRWDINTGLHIVQGPPHNGTTGYNMISLRRDLIRRQVTRHPFCVTILFPALV